MSNNDNDDAINLDEILLEIGQFGRYQIKNYCYIVIPIMFSAIYNTQYIFNAGDVDYRCKVPECESSPPEFDTNGWGIWALPETGNNCERLMPINNTCTPEDFHVNLTMSCTSWVYASANTIVTEFDLACEEWKRTLVGTIHSAGLFAALPITGYMSDAFGRRTTFVMTALSAAVSGLARSFSPNYIVYLVLEFVEATLGSGVYSTGFILALEMVGLKQRVLGGNILSCMFAIGQVVLALVAWFVPYWRTLTQVIYAPSLLFVFYFFFIEESVRWLLSKGKKKEAAVIIFKAAAINNKKLSPAYVKQLTEDPEELQTGKGKKQTSKYIIRKSKKKGILSTTTPENEQKKKSLALEVIQSKILMIRLCICSFWWITVTFIYYGLSINSVSISGNMYINYILTSLVEIPGYGLSVLSLDRFGRKSSIMIAFFVCGISLLCLPFIPKSLQWMQTSLTMLGKLCISMTFSSIYIYTSELFPTVARHRLLGFCSMIGRIGSIVAPQTPLLMRYMESLPYLVFGVLAGCSGALMLLTPETLHMRLPDTVAQAENIAMAPRSSRRTDIFVD